MVDMLIAVSQAGVQLVCLLLLCAVQMYSWCIDCGCIDCWCVDCWCIGSWCIDCWCVGCWRIGCWYVDVLTVDVLTVDVLTVNVLAVDMLTVEVLMYWHVMYWLLMYWQLMYWLLMYWLLMCWLLHVVYQYTTEVLHVLFSASEQWRCWWLMCAVQVHSHVAEWPMQAGAALGEETQGQETFLCLQKVQASHCVPAALSHLCLQVSTCLWWDCNFIA